MEILEFCLLILLVLAFFAGAIETVVGGGGLIQRSTFFGTNKCANVFGTASATWRYARQVRMLWRTVLPTTLAALAFSYLGAAAGDCSALLS